MENQSERMSFAYISGARELTLSPYLGISIPPKARSSLNRSMQGSPSLWVLRSSVASILYPVSPRIPYPSHASSRYTYLYATNDYPTHAQLNDKVFNFVFWFMFIFLFYHPNQFSLLFFSLLNLLSKLHL